MPESRSTQSAPKGESTMNPRHSFAFIPALAVLALLLAATAQGYVLITPFNSWGPPDLPVQKDMAGVLDRCSTGSA